MRLYEPANGAAGPSMRALERQAIGDESVMESILHVNPELIVDDRLLIIGRQVTVNTGTADLVACDRFGNIVVVEVKIGDTGTESASEETILSQPQMYASALEALEYEDLNEIYQEYISRIRTNEWKVTVSSERTDTLRDAYESSFGVDLAETQFNRYQRLVVVAEQITEQTADHASWLLKQGVPFHCTEVRWFDSTGDPESPQAILARRVVVDYELRQVRPADFPKRTYPDLNTGIVEPVFEQLRDEVNAETPSGVFPDGLESRGPYLVSRNDRHPEGIRYYLSVKPHEEGKVTIGIHNMTGDVSVQERLWDVRDRLMDLGFEHQDNPHYNLVYQSWSAETVDEVHTLQLEISEQFKRLVLIGHEALNDPTGG